MGEALILLATNFLWGAYHAVQPGHGKTIAAAYIVGARGRPVDAWILGIFVTLSHTSGIVLVGVLASLGLPGLESRHLEVWLKVLTGVLIIAIGLRTLWTQRALFKAAGALPAGTQRQDDGHDQAHALVPSHSHAHGHEHGHEHEHEHAHGHGHAHPLVHSHDALPEHSHDPAHQGQAGYHSHGFGIRHSHDLSGVMSRRPSLWMLVGLGVAGGLVPDPVALSLLIRALTDGQVIVGLLGVFVFSLGFAAVLVAVGVVAAAVGKRLLQWLSGPRAARLQIGMSALIVLVGVVLTAIAVGEMAQIEGALNEPPARPAPSPRSR
jgi:nickel/cobalt transporter (NicO) family protein